MSKPPPELVTMVAAPQSVPTIARRILADAARTKGFWIGLGLITASKAGILKTKAPKAAKNLGAL